MSLKDIIVHSFLKYGIFKKLGRSEGYLINIYGFQDYKIPAAEKEFHLLSAEESDDSSAETKMSYAKGNINENSSSDNFPTHSSSEDCLKLVGCSVIFNEETFT